jgi:acyl-CoA synthetase (AMP-forming)/AMP-acid ligase II
LNIAEILSVQASERGGSPALIESYRRRDRIVSFQALESAAARIAARIAREGIRTGERVLILHPMSSELYAFLIALLRVGAVGVILDPSAGHRFIERCLRIAQPKAFFGSAKAHLLRLWIPQLRRIPLAFCSTRIPGAICTSLGTDGLESPTIFPADDDTPALITFTSGSTGEPKAALRTHGFLLAQHRALEASLKHRSATMDLTTLPIFVLSNLASGVTSVLPDADMRRPGRIAARPVLRQLERLPISTMAASPAFIARLTAECRKSRMKVASMQAVFMGGAPVFRQDLWQAREAFPNAEITAIYGSTEAEPMAEISLSSVGPADFDDMARGRGLLAGPPVASIDLRILRIPRGKSIGSLSQQQFAAMCSGPESVGEIVVSGAHVLTSYWNGAGDADTKFRVNGKIWHRTGDLGWMDRAGRLWLMGRAAAAIEDCRGVLYPFAVECAARQISGVRHAAVVALAGRRVLVLEAESRTVDAVLSKLEWAQFDEVRMLRSIPMDRRHNAKVDYPELLRTIAGR